MSGHRLHLHSVDLALNTDAVAATPWSQANDAGAATTCEPEIAVSPFPELLLLSLALIDS